MKSICNKTDLLALSFLIVLSSMVTSCVTPKSSRPTTDRSTAQKKKLATTPSAQLIEIKTRPGVTQRFILIKPIKPVASVILFEGGTGNLGLGKFFGKPTVGVKIGTLLSINREDFAKYGLMVALVNAPSDQKSEKGMLQYSKKNNEIFRMSNEHAQDIKAVVAFLKNEANVPVWLIGISRGSFSVTNCGIRIKERVDGLVLASSVTQPATRTGFSPNGILSMDIDKIKAPTLIVAHKKDKCPGCPPSGAPKIKEALINSQNVEIMYFTGGKKQELSVISLAPPGCRALTPHGFYGIEEQVVSAIAKFIKSNSK